MHDGPETAGTSPAGPPTLDPPALPRQRWRLVLARSPEVAGASQREVTETWEAALLGSGLPIARTDGAAGRPRIAFAAPLPIGVAAEAERLDVVLTERWPIWQVRAALEPVVPTGWHLMDLLDVWLGGPPLPGQVVGFAYRITLGAGVVTAPAVEAACAALLAADRVERERTKGTGTVRYDLRPLVADVAVLDPGPPILVRARTRSHPERGTGRPEEVIAALTVSIGSPLEIASIVRERLYLADEVDDEATARRDR